jgi:hypothetical protein
MWLVQYTILMTVFLNMHIYRKIIEKSSIFNQHLQLAL